MVEMILAGLIHYTAKRLQQHQGLVTMPALVDAVAGAVEDVSDVLRRAGFKIDAGPPKMRPPLKRPNGSGARRPRGGRQ